MARMAPFCPPGSGALDLAATYAHTVRGDLHPWFSHPSAPALLPHCRSFPKPPPTRVTRRGGGVGGGEGPKRQRSSQVEADGRSVVASGGAWTAPRSTTCLASFRADAVDDGERSARASGGVNLVRPCPDNRCMDKSTATEFPLWKAGLDDYGASGTNNLGVLHPFDVDRAKELLRDLYDVGDRPSYEEFSEYLAELWPQHEGAQRTLRDLWRTLLRNPRHRFRLNRPPSRFYTVDRVCRAAELEPLERRLRRRMGVAVDAVLDAGGRDANQLQLELDASVEAIKDLGRLRALLAAQATQRASASSSR